MRKLTIKFGSYKLGQYEKKTGKGVMDLLDIGNLEVNKIANIIMLGNPQMKNEEEAYQRLDDYLSSDEEHSIISAFFDLIDEMDKDLKLLKSCGISVNQIKQDFQLQVQENVNKTGINDPKVLADKVADTVDNKESESEN